MANVLFAGVLFHVAQSGEVIEDLPPGPDARGREFLAFFQRTHLLQGQRIALDGGRSMAVARASVLLQRRYPGQVHYRTEDALAQRRHLLHFRQQAGSDSELRGMGHAASLVSA